MNGLSIAGLSHPDRAAVPYWPSSTEHWDIFYLPLCGSVAAAIIDVIILKQSS